MDLHVIILEEVNSEVFEDCHDKSFFCAIYHRTAPDYTFFNVVTV